MAVETERKFIIEMPSLEKLASQKGYFSAEIKQSYLIRICFPLPIQNPNSKTPFKVSMNPQAEQ